jgi:hypothetical protein
MSGWTSDDLTRIGSAEEVELAPVGEDGAPGRPVTIWIVRLGDDLFVRSVRGRASGWFRRVQARHEARIRGGGVEADVQLSETDARADEIDAAYRAKYHRYAADIVESVATPEARAATLELAPRP